MPCCVAEPASVYRDASEELSAFAGFGPVISTAGIIVFSFIVQVSHASLPLMKLVWTRPYN